jgi:ABC-type branched-subunit amino acid transport system ATPase component
VVDHDMSFMTSVCDRVVVLDAGHLLLSGPPGEVTKDPRVVEVYLGSPIDAWEEGAE